MACVQVDGRQGDRRGEMAQESLFSENWCSASAGQQGEDQKHYECPLFSCDQVGVDREESNHKCSPERETAESTRRSAEPFYFVWRPRRDLNPRYRRERAMS